MTPTEQDPASPRARSIWDGLGLGRPFDQIGFVVADLDAAMAAMSLATGIEPWAGWVYDSTYLGFQRYHGRDQPFAMIAALSGSRPQIELIQPLGPGPSIYHDFLASSGPGVHHVAYFVESYRDASKHLQGCGYDEVQVAGGHGLDGDGVFGYFDATKTLGLYLELVQAPKRRQPPQFSYPKATEPIDVQI